jgi:O-methyltransferase/methyltransferase family protein
MADADPATSHAVPSPGQMLLAMARAYRTSQLVYVAAKLRIADELAGGPRTCEELAASVGASTDALCRVMRGLSAMGVFERQTDGRFALTRLSEPLRSTSDGSVRQGVVYLGQEQYRAWGDLLHTVMTGEPAFRTAYGDPFEYYERNPETGEAFYAFMTAATQRAAGEIAFNYDFPESGTVVDVGGGEGQLLAAILIARPRLHGILFDRRPVIEKARRNIESQNLMARCELMAGDFREEVPSGADLYVLKNVLHDWDDAGALEILAACRRAMTPSSRLVVIQRAVPDWPVDPELLRSVAEADLMQLVYSGGRERTEAEYRSLLEAAGLTLSSTMRSDGITWLMEARPAAT